MTVHVVIPVFNRLPMTQSLIRCLRRQAVDQPLHLLVVDDGSTDGTSAWLAAQTDIEILKGDGSLFWGGAVDLAVRHLENVAARHDWVLLMNNDTTVTPEFIQQLLDIAVESAPAAVGSTIRDRGNPARLLSIGVRIDAWRILTRDLLDDEIRKERLPRSLRVDALSGRGVLFPMASLIAAGGMRPRTLPHYLADYEVSLRVRAHGWRLLVTPTAAVYSDDDYGSRWRTNRLVEKLFSVRSPFYLPALAAFWWRASNWPQRLTLPIRLVLFILFPRLRKPAS